MRVAIIGSGLQCQRRAPTVKQSGCSLVVIASRTKEHAEKAAATFGCEASTDWRRLVDRPDLDVIVVCTPPHLHAQISIAAMRAGKHVLCEKPLTKTVEEAEEMLATARSTGRVLKCGFNHRHHPAIRDAKAELDKGSLGSVMFLRCRYGICGRPGFEKEWRADVNQAAGGQFIEQGTHAIDLFRWFGGEVKQVSCMTANAYFKEQPMEDNGAALFRMQSGAIAVLHTSLTEWKNRFSFEVFGTDGYLAVDGLGASYGTESLAVGKKDFFAPFESRVIEYRGGDISWRDEWNEFLRAIKEGRSPLGDAHDGLAAMRIAEAAYTSEAKKSVIEI